MCIFRYSGSILRCTEYHHFLGAGRRGKTCVNRADYREKREREVSLSVYQMIRLIRELRNIVRVPFVSKLGTAVSAFRRDAPWNFAGQRGARYLHTLTIIASGTNWPWKERIAEFCHTSLLVSLESSVKQRDTWRNLDSNSVFKIYSYSAAWVQFNLIILISNNFVSNFVSFLCNFNSNYWLKLDHFEDLLRDSPV